MSINRCLLCLKCKKDEVNEQMKEVLLVGINYLPSKARIKGTSIVCMSERKMETENKHWGVCVFM